MTVSVPSAASSSRAGVLRSDRDAMESLTLSFSPSLLPLRQRWRNNGLSADFLGDYVTTFFPGQEGDPQAPSQAKEVKAAITYVANELLENAMKYSDRDLPYPVTIRLILHPDRIVCLATNAVDAAHAAAMRRYVADLESSDPQELYITILEQGGRGEGGSGLGVVTMINDYGAAVTFDIVPNADGSETVTTRAEIPLGETLA